VVGIAAKSLLHVWRRVHRIRDHHADLRHQSGGKRLQQRHGVTFQMQGIRLAEQERKPFVGVHDRDGGSVGIQRQRMEAHIAWLERCQGRLRGDAKGGRVLTDCRSRGGAWHAHIIERRRPLVPDLGHRRSTRDERPIGGGEIGIEQPALQKSGRRS